MAENNRGILEQILYELQMVRKEFHDLRNLIKQDADFEESVNEIPIENKVNKEENKTSDNITEEVKILADKETGEYKKENDVEKWILERVENFEKRNTNIYTFLDEVALFIGNNYNDLRYFFHYLKSSLSYGGRFNVNFSDRTQNEISASTQLCNKLMEKTLLESYYYKNKQIKAKVQELGKIHNFFTGRWFERYIFIKFTSFLSQNNLSYNLLENVHIELPNHDTFELDFLFLVEDIPFWLECKTSKKDNSYYIKYSKMRKYLKISKNRSFMIVLDIDDKQAKEISALYDITVTNEVSFLSMLSNLMDITEEQQIVTPVVITVGRELSAILNKLRLRPLPDIRFRIIQEFVNVVNSVEKPLNLIEIKKMISEKITDVSKNKLQDVNLAIMKTGILLDENDQPIQTFKTPIYKVEVMEPSEINRLCIRVYADSVLAQKPNYINSKEKKAEFQEVTGEPFPDSVS